MKLKKEFDKYKINIFTLTVILIPILVGFTAMIGVNTICIIDSEETNIEILKYIFEYTILCYLKVVIPYSIIYWLVNIIYKLFNIKNNE